jgi:hypothetical protein
MADRLTGKNSLSPWRERVRVRGSKFKKNIPKYMLRLIFSENKKLITENLYYNLVLCY